MEIRDIKKEELNLFLIGIKHSPFLLSWEWGEFQARAGFKVFRFGVEDEGKLAAAFTLIKKPLGLGKSYLYCPKVDSGIMNQESGTGGLLFNHIAKISKEENCIFLRFEQGRYPISNNRYPIIKTFDIQPKKTIVSDISRTDEELLDGFHQKTRYNIRLAKKKGVAVRECGGDEDFEAWWKIMQETCSRDGFRLHGKEYYKKMLEINEKSGIRNSKLKNNEIEAISNFQFPVSVLTIKLLVAEYEGRIIAGNIVSFFGDTATYVHGASSNEYRNVMATYLLQWKAMKRAKALDCKFYDFYGIDEKKWPGVTRFKQGFGGDEIAYPGTYDMVYGGLWYNVYKALRRIRRKI